MIVFWIVLVYVGKFSKLARTYLKPEIDAFCSPCHRDSPAGVFKKKLEEGWLEQSKYLENH